MNYVQLNIIAEEDAARFRNVLNFYDDFELLEGIPLQGSFPADAAYRMDDEFPDSMALHDMLDNLDRQLIVSERVRSFLEKEEVQHVEYLPVKVLNHKDREVKARYCIVNPYPLVDCIDKSKTQFEWNTLNDQAMTDVTQLTLLEERIPPDLKLLRLKHLSEVTLVHRALAQKMKDAHFRGFSTTELSAYRWG